MSKITNFAAPTPSFAEALAFAHNHSMIPAFRPFHWLNLSWDLRRRYPAEGARSLMRVGVSRYDPIVTEERFARNWIAADRKESKTSDECLVTRMQEWREKVAYWTRHHEARIRSQ
jgi:hypothetical protein